MSGLRLLLGSSANITRYVTDEIEIAVRLAGTATTLPPQELLESNKPIQFTPVPTNPQKIRVHCVSSEEPKPATVDFGTTLARGAIGRRQHISLHPSRVTRVQPVTQPCRRSPTAVPRD